MGCLLIIDPIIPRNLGHIPKKDKGLPIFLGIIGSIMGRQPIFLANNGYVIG